MIYGYSKRTVDPEFGLLEMREVSFQFSSQELRRIAAFLAAAADDLDSGNFKNDHRHLQDAVEGWAKDSDVIVLPSPDAG